MRGQKLGFRHSDVVKAALAEASRGNTNKRGKKLSDVSRERIRQSLFGKKRPPLSLEHRQNLSKSGIGRKFSDEHRRKLSLACRRRLAEEGWHGIGVDTGATEYFDNLNQTQGFHIQHPNVYFKELGYFADGYDPILHAWFEYDTPSHNRLKSAQKDLVRQAEVIDHFKKNGKPLTGFWRINATGIGEPGMRNMI